MVLCAQLPMACLLLQMICLLGATYPPFRAHDETVVTSDVATSDLSDGGLANSNSHDDHESETGSGGVLALRDEAHESQNRSGGVPSLRHEACCRCVLESESLRPTCWHPRRPSCGYREDEENEIGKLNDEMKL